MEVDAEARAATARAMQMEPNTPPERAAASAARGEGVLEGAWTGTLQVPVTMYVQSGETLTCPL